MGAVFLGAVFFLAPDFLAAVFFAAGSSSLSSPRADFAAATDFCSAASRSTTSPEVLVDVSVRLISPPSIFDFTSDSTAPA